jgi:hypothetical protein
VLLVGFRNLPYVSQFGESLSRERRRRTLAFTAGTRTQVGHGHELQVAYYAGADLMYLPYAESDVALRYVAKRNPLYCPDRRSQQVTTRTRASGSQKACRVKRPAYLRPASAGASTSNLPLDCFARGDKLRRARSIFRVRRLRLSRFITIG